MKFVHYIIILGALLVSACNDDDKRSESNKITGEQAAELSGVWESNCFREWGTTIDDKDVYSIETKNYSGDSLLVTADQFGDSNCTDFLQQKTLQGNFEFGELYEVDADLFARDIAETYLEPFENVRSITWHAYFFIDGQTLYFGADKGEGGDEPHLVTEKPYTFIQ